MLERKDPLYYCGDEIRKYKQKKIQNVMEKNGLDGILFFKPEAIRYMTDFFVKGFRSVSMDIEYLSFQGKGKDPVLAYQSGSDTWRIQVYNWVKDYRKLNRGKWHETIREIFYDCNITKGRIGTDLLSFDLYLKLKEMLPGVEFVDAEDVWRELTVVKHPKEIEIIKEALRIASLGLAEGIRTCREGVHEYEVAAAAEYTVRRHGAEMVPVIPIVASGLNSSINERIASERVMEGGDLVIIDFGCVHKGYVGEFCRTTVVGKARNQFQIDIYKTVLDALKAAEETIKPGVTCAEIDATARKVIRNSGFGKYEHRWATGHQLGYGLHGDPLIAQGVNEPLVPNMLFNLEPRVTMWDRPDVGGVIIEDTFLVTEKGCEKLTSLGYEEKLLSK
jgi:Xaa-Pro aminopeptidase